MASKKVKNANAARNNVAKNTAKIIKAESKAQEKVIKAQGKATNSYGARKMQNAKERQKTLRTTAITGNAANAAIQTSKYNSQAQAELAKWNAQIVNNGDNEGTKNKENIGDTNEWN